MFDPHTHVLTSGGWLPVADLTTDHLIAVFDPADATLRGHEYPSAVYAEAYTGCLWALEGAVSLRITPSHTLYLSLSDSVEARYQPVFGMRPADDALSGRYRHTVVAHAPCRVRRGGAGTRSLHHAVSPLSGIDSESHARLLGFFAGDGHASDRYNDALEFHLRKPGKLAYLAALCEDSGLLYVDRHGKRQVVYPGIGRWYRQIGYHEGHKTLPGAVLQASQAVLAGVIDGLRHSDGYTRPGQSGFEYATTSPHLAAMIQALGVVAGQPFSCTIRSGCYRLQTLSAQAMPHLNDARKVRDHVGQVHYDGPVYGLTVATGVIAVRREMTTVLIGGC